MTLPVYKAQGLAPALKKLLLDGERLPCGNYDLRFKRAPGGTYDVMLDGACFRAGLDEATAFRVCAHLRAAALAEWGGKSVGKPGDDTPKSPEGE